MKLTKRMKNSIIQGVIANIFSFMILIIIMGLFIYPRFIEAEKKKDTLVNVYNKIQNINTKGISFQDFKTAINSSDFSKESYTLNLMKNISEEFYLKSFTNTGSSSYNVFLGELRNEITIKKGSDEYIKKDETLSTVLPIYDEKNIFSNDGLSDFFFTNYIENVLYSFNLSSVGDIGIGGLEKQGEENKATQEDSFQEDIYSISLFFDISGQKTDVVDFIHYFENVGGIKIVGDGLEIYEDEFITKRLEGTETEIGYNIYKNQIADIASLGLIKYPDSSSLKTDGLLEAMKGDQAREKIDVEVELSFYVVGVPGYKMEEYIQDFLGEYQELQKSISQDAQKYTTQASKFNEGEQLLSIKNLQSLDNVVTLLNEDIVKIRTRTVKNEDIQSIYNQVVIYNQQLMRIKASYEKQLNILTK